MYSLFYTAMGNGRAVKTIESCYTKHFDNHNFVSLPNVVDPKWVTKTGKAVSEFGGKAALETFQKRLCQAFAKQSAGTVYFFIPEGMTPRTTSTWSVHEYPLLTRNIAVNMILRVDPSKEGNMDGGQGTIIWESSMGPQGTVTVI